MEKLITFPNEKLDFVDKAVVTLSMPLHVTDVSSEKDTVQLRNLLDEASNNLKQAADFDRDESLLLIEQVEDIRKYEDQLVDSDGGLVLYVTTDEIYYYHVDTKPVNNVTFARYPNKLPLIKNYQYIRNYHVLILDQEGIRLLEKSGGRLFEIDLKENAKDSNAEQDAALGADLTEKELKFGSHNKTGAGVEPFNFEHNETIFEKQDDLKHYFNTVDRYIKRNYSSKTGYPLILFSLNDNQSLFREVSENDFLLEENIEESASQLHDDQIKEKVKEKEKEITEKQQNELLERFNETKPQYRIDDNLQSLSMSGMKAQIEELIVEENYLPVGSITGNGIYQDNNRTDYLHQLVSLVLNTDGSVYILPKEHMLKDVKLSAKLRY